MVSPDSLTVWIRDNGNQPVSIWARSDTDRTVWEYSGACGSQSVDIDFPADFRSVLLVRSVSNSVSMMDLLNPA